MKIGIGLPNHVAGVSGSAMGAWARRAEERGFESVTTIDRLIYPCLDSLVALSVAAGATSELGLVTNVLLTPLYSTPVLAKQLATVASCAGDRLTIGIGVGSRPDDYAAVGVDFGKRGRVLDDQIEAMRRAWSGQTTLCSAPVQIPLLFGGRSEATIRRATTVGDGWVAGALRDFPTQSVFADRVRAGWQAAGRPGEPQIHASVNFALGSDEVVQAGRDHLARYYGFKPDYAKLNVDDMIHSAEEARHTVRGYRDLGFDRLLFHPAVASLDQIDRLADAVL
ncbi:LLM class flavin-dependent oxidoreductase [Mycolicibacterium sphagni]|uniref:LLM class flavin-dependent oxidoreductase n=1 Tax=Mycolicibacterium sphagni TaxID=1786 RepID=A0A255DJC6_9MYCO|nr:LLM class flavin-dependent oxidoreductase [Mycolicibacterium sphagni]MCV7180219.1 LLM class flavin-dependent oxidoreductase [Mycolicibacterium sphagni]OYN75743.1 LLM class flavin-dependent oxidoreductase [Mycolicibacterium sphagni]